MTPDHSLFDPFEGIATGETGSRPVPVGFGVGGHAVRRERHCVCRKRSGDGDIGVVTAPHRREHRLGRFLEDRMRRGNRDGTPRRRRARRRSFARSSRSRPRCVCRRIPLTATRHARTRFAPVSTLA